VKGRLLEIGLVATPKVLGGVLAVALNAVLMRFLGPAEFGVFSLAAAVIILFDSILGSSVDNALLQVAQAERHRGPAHVLAVERAALALKLGLWLVVAVAAAPFASALAARFLHDDGRAGVVAIVLLAAAGVLAFRSALAHWQIRERFPVYGALDTAQMVLKFGAIGALLVLAVHPTVEAIVALLGAAPFTVAVAAAASGRLPLFAARPAWAVVVRVAGKAKWFLLTFGVSVLLNRLDVFLLTKWSTLREVGIYSGGQVFAVIPEMVGSLVSIVFVPRIYAYWSARRIGALARAVLVLGAAVAAAAMAAAVLLRAYLEPLFPPQFAASAHVLFVLLPGYFAGMIAFPLVIPFLMFARPRAILLLDLLTLPFVVILYGWLIAREGALGAAWAATITRTARVGVMHLLAWRVLRRSPLPPASDVRSDA